MGVTVLSARESWLGLPGRPGHGGASKGTLSGMKAIGTGEEEGGEDRRRVGEHPVDGHPPRAVASTVCGRTAFLFVSIC